MQRPERLQRRKQLESGLGCFGDENERSQPVEMKHACATCLQSVMEKLMRKLKQQQPLQSHLRKYATICEAAWGTAQALDANWSIIRTSLNSTSSHTEASSETRLVRKERRSVGRRWKAPRLKQQSLGKSEYGCSTRAVTKRKLPLQQKSR